MSKKQESPVVLLNQYTNATFDPSASEEHQKTTEETEGAPGRTSSRTELESAEGEIDRQQFSSPIEFVLSCTALSVGLGNVWRFPYTAYANGGGAFLIPYLIVLFVIGKPLYFLELILGQFTSCGPVKIWSIAPLFKGLGYAQAMASFLVVTFYCSLMGLCVFYFIASLQSELPWASCGEWSDKETCYDENTVLNDTTNLTSASQQYYEREVLKMHGVDRGLDDGIGLPNWRLLLCLLFSWVCVFLSLVKGVKSAGKVAYFTAIFPYVVLITLLIRGVTLPGAMDGVIYFVKPQWEKLLDANVWYAAVAQSFFSLSVSFGAIAMFASFSPFKHNLHRDVFFISVMDTFTSLISGVTIFAIIGNLAYELDKDVEDVVTSDEGLAFVSYPEAISKFPSVPQLFSCIFFLMLFTLGVGSAVGLISTSIIIVHDHFPRFSKFWITTFFCIVGFLAGIPYVTPGGPYILSLVNFFGGGFCIFVIATVEIIAIVLTYGIQRLSIDTQFMLGTYPSWFWRFTWTFTSPLLLLVILVYALSTLEVPVYQDAYHFSPGVLAICWTATGFLLALIPCCGIHSIMSRKADDFVQKVKESASPSRNWGPKNPKTKELWISFCDGFQEARSKRWPF